jgi:hypothetical protein
MKRTIIPSASRPDTSFSSGWKEFAQLHIKRELRQSPPRRMVMAKRDFAQSLTLTGGGNQIYFRN